MNGFMSRGGRLLGLAVALSAGCHALETRQETEVAGGCSTGTRSCGGLLDGWFAHHQDKEFDWEKLHTDHCWPEQFNRESQRRINAPFGQQLINGNRIELTIWAHYFETRAGQEAKLNAAGERRLQYLARKKPFVIPYLELEASFDRELDERRIASIVEAANRYSFDPANWQVAVVNRKPIGMFGPEATNGIMAMYGTGLFSASTALSQPRFEPNIKRTFQ